MTASARPTDKSDFSGGWEAAAKTFIGQRSGMGVRTVQAWGRSFQKGAAIIDLGCGPGVPITQVLVDAGLTVYGIDAAPSMIAAFRRRFPEVPVACETVEQSSFFGRTFDGAVAWGLVP
jgi:2-polyprenyl-3-methyl-5-hydroxy-6-metoxy-1,4-benzoquinol methylase